METVFTLIGWNNIERRHTENNMLIKKKILKVENSNCQTAGVDLKPYQFCVGLMWFGGYTLSKVFTSSRTFIRNF